MKFWQKNTKITKNWYICINLFVMGKNTSIVLGNHFEEFINSVIASGSYSSTSEVIRAGLRILEENEIEKQLLLKELKKGEESGIVENYDFKAHLKELKASRKQ